MSDGSDDGTRWSRRRVLAGIGSAVFVATGNVTANPARRLGSGVVVETVPDARRLARALAADLAAVTGVEARVRVVETEGDGTDVELAETNAETPVVSVTVPGVYDHGDERRTHEADGDAAGHYDVPLDLARFVPSRTEWYPVRPRHRRPGSETQSGSVESWVEYGVGGPTDDGKSLPRSALERIERVRPERPPGSASTVLVYGTRAFQYASGFGGRGYYEVEGDRLRSLASRGELSTDEDDLGSTDEGNPIVRYARVTANGSATERFGDDAVAHVLSRYGPVRA